MQHDQTNLVQHVISLYSGFEIISTIGELLDHDGKHSVLNYRWISYNPRQHPIPPEATMSASLTSSHWYAIASTA
ncbi:MAG: hypothetical protein V7707_20180 [Motiliproteus sp.]